MLDPIQLEKQPTQRKVLANLVIIDMTSHLLSINLQQQKTQPKNTEFMHNKNYAIS
jgi:hypothetical protein